jgi:hypothetical protein
LIRKIYDFSITRNVKQYVVGDDCIIELYFLPITAHGYKKRVVKRQKVCSSICWSRLSFYVSDDVAIPNIGLSMPAQILV